jgi:DNA-binding MarR family transcriptional regulator
MDTQEPGAARSEPVRPGDGRSGADAIAIIELELMKLVRHLETFGRRCSLYVRVDRAGYLAMRMLETLGPVNTNTLAQALHLDASTVTRQVTALESQGFVERRANPADGRSSTIALTPRGRQSMLAVEQERRRNIEALVSDWDSVQQIDLGVALTRLNDSLAASVTEPDDSRQRQDARTPASR